MINFRFHLASLVAIFLALALGVVIGAGVIDRGVVDTLNNRLDSVERKSDRIEGENNALRSENGELAEAIRAEQCHAVEDKMLGDDLVVVAVRGVDEQRVDDTIAAAQCAGGQVGGVVWLEQKWALADGDDAREMAAVLQTTTRRPAGLRAAAWKQLAERLEAGPPAEDAPGDVLASLQDAGFVAFEQVGEDGLTLAQFPARGASVLLVVGRDGDLPEAEVVMPGASALVAAGIPTVVGDVYVPGDDAPGRGSALDELRDSPLARTVSTVDNLDRPQGPTTAVLALAGVQQVPPLVGHYGLTGDQVLPDTITQ